MVWSITDIACYLYHSFSFLDKHPSAFAGFIDMGSRIFLPIGTGLEAILILVTLPSSLGLWKFTDYLRCILSIIWWPGIYPWFTHFCDGTDSNINQESGSCIITQCGIGAWNWEIPSRANNVLHVRRRGVVECTACKIRFYSRLIVFRFIRCLFLYAPMIHFSEKMNE